MKKCPFCAEDIQDNAIKCKHCGEWIKEGKQSKQEDLPHQLPQKDNVNPEQVDVKSSSPNPSKCNNPIEKQVIHDSNENDDDADDERHYKPLMKKKNKWGWGWLYLLIGFALASNKIPIDKKPSQAVTLIGIVILMYSYFWWRNKLIIHFSVKDIFIRLWLISIMAGILAIFTEGIVAAILQKMGL